MVTSAPIISQASRRIHWAYLVLVAVLGGGLWWLLRESPEDQVTHLVEGLAAGLSEAASTNPARPELVKRALEDAVLSPVVLNIAETGRQEMRLDELTGTLALLAGEYVGTSFEVGGLTVTVDAKSQRAQVVGDITTRMLLPGGGQRVDERRFAAVLRPKNGHYRIVSGELMAPRIDQPEARP